MLRSRKTHHSRCEVWFFFSVLELFFVLMECYDPCPESLRHTSAARPSTIPGDEIERAFQKAKDEVENLMNREEELVRSGRTLSHREKSPASVHHQAFVNPEVRRREVQQRIFHESTKILAKDNSLTSEEVSCSLPKADLTGRTASEAMQNCTPPEIQCDPSYTFRYADGSCNNLNNPTWGCAFSCFSRCLAACYSDNESPRKSAAGGPLPAPRNISLKIHQNYDNPNNQMSHMYVFFGQYLDHDVTLTPASTTGNNNPIQCCPIRSDNHPQCDPIEISKTDPFYSKYGVSCLNFVRSALCPNCALGHRQQINACSAFIDASHVYGNSVNETNGLRDSARPAYLRGQMIGNEYYLPPSSNPTGDRCSVPSQNQTCFVAGDPRVNQHPTLTSLHTVWYREHNRVASLLEILNPNWSAERIFQEARKILGAQMQMITYNEYLPHTLGHEGMDRFNLWVSSRRTSYNGKIDPTLSTEFSTFAFRLHTLVNSLVAENPGQPGHYGHLLRDVFIYPFDVPTEINYLMRGSATSRSQRFDRHLVEDVTNYLYRTQGNETGLDLAALNIQRGRDHGIAPYADIVEYCSEGKMKVKNFDDLCDYKVMSRENCDKLRETYGHVRDIDAFTGMCLEYPKRGATVGPTSICFLGKHFRNLKYGDRFYFEHAGEAGSLTNDQLNEIKKVTLSGVICKNTGVTQMQPEAMLLPSDYNRVVPCSQIRQMNLEPWREN